MKGFCFLKKEKAEKKQKQLLNTKEKEGMDSHSGFFSVLLVLIQNGNNNHYHRISTIWIKTSVTTPVSLFTRVLSDTVRHFMWGTEILFLHLITFFVPFTSLSGDDGCDGWRNDWLKKKKKKDLTFIRYI